MSSESAERKVMIVTGANSGIGKEIARNLAASGAEVVMACRSLSRGRAAREELCQALPEARLHLMELDQSSQESIRAFVHNIESMFPRLDVLVNNAGIYPASRELSVDGVENTWATNVMGYFLLALMLEEKLKASAPSRLLFVASSLAGGLDLRDLQLELGRFGKVKAYKASKQANRMLAWVFAERLREHRVDVNVIHPGGVATGIARYQRGLWGHLARLAFKTQKPVGEGADTATWLALDEGLEGQSGHFWADRRARHCEFRDMDQCRLLWKKCRDLVREDIARGLPT